MNNENQNGINNMVNQNGNQGIASMTNQATTPVEQSAPVVQNASGELPTAEPLVEGTKCPKCGFSVSEGNQMCMHCGCVLGSLATDAIGTAVNNNQVQDTKVEVVYDEFDDTPDKRKFKKGPIFITNGIIYGVLLLILIVTGSLDASTLGTMIGILPALFIVCCIQILLLKAELPWWGTYIPVYSFFLISKLMTDDYGYILYLIIPSAIISLISGFLTGTFALFIAGGLLIYELVMSIKMSIKFAHRFGANPWLVIFFPYIMYIVMAFNDKYSGV